MKVSLNTAISRNLNTKKTNTVSNSIETRGSKKENNGLSSLDYRALVNKATMNKSKQVSFGRNGLCLIDKTIWDKLSDKEKLEYWKHHGSYEFFGLDKDCVYNSDCVFHTDLDRLKSRINFANNFAGHYEIYTPMPWHGETSTYGFLSHLRQCFCDDEQEEKKRQDFALFLKNNIYQKSYSRNRKGVVEAVQVDMRYAIRGNKLDDNAVILAKTNYNAFDDITRLSDKVISHIGKTGFDISYLYDIAVKHLNNEELSDEQLDFLADLNLYTKAYGEKCDKLLSIFEDLKLDERVDVQDWVENPDGTTSQVLKTKYSEFYKVTNGTSNTYLANERYRNYVNNDVHQYYPYMINFPKGTFRPTSEVEIRYSRPKGNDYYDFREKIVNSYYDGEKRAVSMPANGTVYFEKLEY
ncbi:MAG: hypothetical protein IJY61_00570 [Candidatus Gastranaerophilales bacterium]|nr:hypothetical protein [Candidatus Gastranaerophilales bacterium]